MHLTDLKAGFLAGIPIVGSAMAIAAGVAMSQQRKKSKNITAVYIGDATVESGTFHETLNYASLHNLPLMTICENNEYSVFTPLSIRQPTNRTITDLAKSHGIKTYEGNGDDILEVVNIIREAKNYMFSESKPVFIEFKTYRLLEHCGPNFDDDLNYRDQEQVNNFKNRDPITLLLDKLFSNGEIDEKEFSGIDIKLKNDIKDLIQITKNEKDASYSLEHKTFWTHA